MCPSMSETNKHKGEITTSPVSQMIGRQVLQPNCDRVPTLQKMRSLPKISPAPSIPSSTSTTPILNVEQQRTSTPPTSPRSLTMTSKFLVSSDPKKSKRYLIKAKSFSARVAPILNTTEYSSATLSITTSLILESPASKQEERKSRIAHYGRVPKPCSNIRTTAAPQATQSQKRCTFITTNSDPIFVAYHDEEWGVPVHDDRLLFELLVLTGAQVGSDWTSVLKKRQVFKDAFAGFYAELVANFSEKKMMSISVTCGIDLSKVRGVVDNANRVLQVTREYGSLEKYLWGFLNNKPMSTNYKTTHKIPVKTSKSESISKDMMRRGFRSVGPTVIHSFLQAAGLTNDHLISCQCHAKCAAMA
ncbi:hypothetical protein QQ045_013754 [Rhodiola kirilowii]